MRAIAGFELFAADLPFRISFKHAAAERTEVESFLAECARRITIGKTAIGKAAETP